MFGIFGNRSEQKRKHAHELKLKKALSAKFSQYDNTQYNSPNDNEDITDYTDILIGNELVKVKKEHITLFDVNEAVSPVIA